MAQKPEQIKIDEKYTYQFDNGNVQLLRDGQYWLDSRDNSLTAAKAWIAAACRIEKLEIQVAQLQSQLAAAQLTQQEA